VLNHIARDIADLDFVDLDDEVSTSSQFFAIAYFPGWQDGHRYQLRMTSSDGQLILIISTGPPTFELPPQCPSFICVMLQMISSATVCTVTFDGRLGLTPVGALHDARDLGPFLIAPLHECEPKQREASACAARCPSVLSFALPPIYYPRSS